MSYAYLKITAIDIDKCFFYRMNHNESLEYREPNN